MQSRSTGGVEYTKIEEIRGPLLVVQGVTRGAYDELVEVETSAGEKRLGKVDRKSTRLNSSHIQKSRMPSSA